MTEVVIRDVEDNTWKEGKPLRILQPKIGLKSFASQINKIEIDE